MQNKTEQANHILRQYLNEKPNYNFSLPENITWTENASELSFETTRQLIRHQSKDISSSFFFYVDFYDDSLKIKNFECFSKKGIKLDAISEQLISEQNKEIAETEKNYLNHSLPQTLKTEFPDNFKF